MDQEKQDSNREKIQVLKELSNKLKEYVETVKKYYKTIQIRSSKLFKDREKFTKRDPN